MSEKKNIDRLFQEKFKDFDAIPSENVWDKIDKELGPKKRKKRPVIIPLWFQAAGIAAAVSLLITIGNDTLNQNNNTNQTITNTNSATNPQHKNTLKNNQRNNNNNIITNPYILLTSLNNIAKNEDNPNTTPNTANGKTSENNVMSIFRQLENTRDFTIINKAEIDNLLRNFNREISAKNKASRTDATNENEDNKKSILEKVAVNENEEEPKEKTKNSNRWMINPNVAPVYFNSLSSGSPIAAEFNDNTKSGSVTMSYGLNIAYQVSDRLSVRSGVNKVNYGYNTNDIAFTPTTQANNITSIAYSKTGENIAVGDQNSITQALSPEIVSKNNIYDGVIAQEIGYIEVPLEVKYRIVDKKLGVNLIGGISSLFLTDNSIALESERLITNIGESRNVNNTNVSTNIGIGVDYKMSDNIQVNVEPMFKYQVNTFTNDGGFKPYTLGVYTGLSFKF